MLPDWKTSRGRSRSPSAPSVACVQFASYARFVTVSGGAEKGEILWEGPWESWVAWRAEAVSSCRTGRRKSPTAGEVDVSRFCAKALNRRFLW